MDAITLLTNDHRAVETLFRRFRSRRSEDGKRETAQEIVKELSIHAAIEETHFYPEVERDLPQQRGLVEHSIEEHQEAKELLARLDDMIDKAHTKKFAQVLERLEGAVEEHVQDEEKEMFPAVRRGLTKTRLNEIGTAMNRAKTSAPTRPHPAAPSRGPVAPVAARAAGAVDRVRDSLSGR